MHTILVVEDDAVNRELITRLLQMRGYGVITANDGVKAIAMARSEQPDLIVMDMGLPVMNGWQATYRIKTVEATSHIPVIALTAYAMSSDRTRALDAGCDDYDVKPIEINRLLNKIEALLARAAGDKLVEHE